ncbi:MAG TPA: chorismate mutase [Candidatus Acidoferrales bacterium]|jgi:chorismate mutase/prephenate dehydratase|nr:chorismate mutase [Candidatus Acidoferrales bacterium]
MDNAKKTVEQWRNEIDILDAELLRLLNERARIASELGALKLSSGLPVYDGRRERQVLARLCESNPGPLDHEGVSSIFRSIIRESRRLESLQQHPQDKSRYRQSGQEYPHGH